MIKKKDDKFVVTDSTGKKVLGEHDSKKEALRQVMYSLLQRTLRPTLLK